MKEPITVAQLSKLLKRAEREAWVELDLSEQQLTEVPPIIGKLKALEVLDLTNNRLTALPNTIGELVNLKELKLGQNRLESLPESVCNLTRLETLDADSNRLKHLPESIGEIFNLKKLELSLNQLTHLPASFWKLSALEDLNLGSNEFTSLDGPIGTFPALQDLSLYHNKLTSIPDFIRGHTKLTTLWLTGNKIKELPDWLRNHSQLKVFSIAGNPLSRPPDLIQSLIELQRLDLAELELQEFPQWLLGLSNLKVLFLDHNRLHSIPSSIEQLSQLEWLWLSNNELNELPPSIAKLPNLSKCNLNNNPLNPILASAAEQGFDALKAYLHSLEKAEPLYECKLVFVGEGDVGKTTLLKALTGRDPQVGEKSTHGVSIDVQAMNLAYPEKPGINIQFNAWDFGGQEVYRVTHQFFFSRRSVYLIVWEPRMGVQQCQVEDWLKLIRLRVGSEARVIIVSTHAKTGERIARIDKSTFIRDFGTMICGFIEVDSLEDDPTTGEKYGIANLKRLIAETAKDLEHMGMPFNVQWRTARDELLNLGQTQPRATYNEFSAVCQRYTLSELDTRTLAGLMHDLGYIVHYGNDERLKNDVVLQPEWLTKAIAFVLEDRRTQECEGVLPDTHLINVWLNHSFKNEPRYDPELYPFFLRLMEKYDVSYRLEDGKASLVAQHVPQVRPSLPWLPEEDPNEDRRRLAMVYVMDEAPPGLVPWMIVRTHEFAFEQNGHRLHWQKGMFLRNRRHGEAMLELRGREFHLYTEAVWPEYFMNILRQTIDKLVADNWPGMQNRYTFNVPCRHQTDADLCSGRFDINALRAFLEDGDKTIRCQSCRTKQEIIELLYGFEDEEPREQLARIESKLDAGFEQVQKEVAGLESRLANYVMAIMRAMANEAKEGPRLFDMRPASGNWKRIFEEKFLLRLWCEAENCQHPVLEKERGEYEIFVTREWVRQIAPYANFIAGVMKTLIPMVGPSLNLAFGAKTVESLQLSDRLDLMKQVTGKLDDKLAIKDPGRLQQGVLSENERSGLLALHTLLREVDPQHGRLGLHRVPTYTGDFLWLCSTHYELSQSRIPDSI